MYVYIYIYTFYSCVNIYFLLIKTGNRIVVFYSLFLCVFLLLFWIFFFLRMEQYLMELLL